MDLYRNSFKWIATLMVVAMALVISGCGTTPSPTTASLDLQASDDVNPDRNGRPSPILVRVYELRSAGVIEGSDFFSLLEDDSTVLGADLLSRWEYQLEPGQVEQLNFEAQPNARYIGIVAAYRDIEHARWRALQALETQQDNPLDVRVGRNEVSIEPR